jgi:molybdenum cofactor cytidylyltransferase
MTSVACIVLAAGTSTRFGRDKREVRNAEGETLLGMTLRNIPPVFTQRILVLHRADEEIGARYEMDWQVIYAGRASEGMGQSIAEAISHVRNCTACLIALGDMPLVQADTYVLLRDAARPDRILVPFFEQKRGNPVMIGSDFFAQLRNLEGDSGARQLMLRHPQLVERLDVQDPGILKDMDTPEELSRIPGFGQLL